MCFLLTGCTFSRQFRAIAGAEGAKTKAYGQLESGEVLIQSNIYIHAGW